MTTNLREKAPVSGLFLTALETRPIQQLLPDMTRNYLPGPEIFSRKVFLGGLPIDIKEGQKDCLNE